MHKLAVLFLCLLGCSSVDEADNHPSNKDFINLPGSTCHPFTKNNNRAIVPIYSLSNDDQYNFHCSGVVISNDQIITAKHCVENAKIKVFVDDVEVPILYTKNNVENDIALIKIQPNQDYSFSKPKIAAKPIMKNEYMLGSIVGFGCPESNYRVSRDGVFTQSSNLKDFLYIFGCICYGDSGGALLNQNGELVGVITNTYQNGMSGLALDAALYVPRLL